MPFSEQTKQEAKRRAHYKCVICQESFLEVHHIVPQSEGGSDEIENAAPLCAGCHDRYGGNPEKRKQLREMRNNWWEFCQKKDTSVGLKFRGEYDPSAEDYNAQNMVIFTADGGAAGTYIALQKVPAGISPDIGS